MGSHRRGALDESELTVDSGMSGLERLVRRDRAIVAAALAAVAASAWAYLLSTDMGMAGHAMSEPMPDMPDMPGMVMPQAEPWSAAEPLALFVMWLVMMVAMMVPSAAPIILLFASTMRRRRERASPWVPTGVFAAGYILIWVGFSAAAAALQMALHRASLLSPAMSATSPIAGGVVLIAAGLYQWLPVKNICLSHCRSPLGFFTTDWREGWSGAIAMGVRHGLFCLGCCWALMALLFVAGVMNLLWVAALSAIVLLEKVAPKGQAIARAAGVGFIVVGIVMIARG